MKNRRGGQIPCGPDASPLRATNAAQGSARPLAVLREYHQVQR
jgi:hypothetical protein